MQITSTNLLADRNEIMLQISALQGKLAYVDQLIAYDEKQEEIIPVVPDEAQG